MINIRAIIFKDDWDEDNSYLEWEDIGEDFGEDYAQNYPETQYKEILIILPYSSYDDYAEKELKNISYTYLQKKHM